jgi:protein tyrosine phosphatase (PTP) superfamily phosphohydrolase (DUF442 family)
MMRHQNEDITAFEDRINEVNTAFFRNCDLGSRKFKIAISAIDKRMSHLERFKEAVCA